MLIRYVFSVFIFLLISVLNFSAIAQQSDWQQRAVYDMDIHLDVHSHKMTGNQSITYFNNSPDTLSRVYYHLYFNAFQPGSMMDERSRTIIDPDRRVRDRIAHLSETEIGYHHIKSLTQDSQPTKIRTEGTILIVDLATPIPPNTSTFLEMEFESQVPVQIRRSGRDNREGIAYSMAQWYPKLAEYDQAGWHTSPYVAREFHGIWSDFYVHITLDRNYTIGGTGYLQNPQEIGHGYENPELPLNVPDTDELTWRFHAPNVIDFMWGADPNFTHKQIQMADGPTIHLLYVERDETIHWEILGEITAQAIRFLNDLIGEYPYDQFSIIQGGDGGMEYPMATLITGHRSLYSLVGVTVHELLHMWFQTTVATNESHYHWIDEGFTVFYSNIVMQHLFRSSGNPHNSNDIGYLRIVHDQLEEPMVQHADHFDTNSAYVVASYRKGSLFLNQLEYIVGDEVFKRAMRRFYTEWKFRHPTPTDFRRVFEKVSGIQLDWYFETMLNSTRTIDLAIKQVKQLGDETIITLENRGDFLLPVDLWIEYEDGSSELIYIPRHEQLQNRDTYERYPNQTNLDAWFWTHNEYSFTLPVPRSAIKGIEIDPSIRIADTNRINNTWPKPYRYSFLQPGNQHRDLYEIGYRPLIWYGENSGLRLGTSMRGNYLFNTKAFDASFALTSGNITDSFEAGQIDVDYLIRYRDRWRFLGPEGWWFASAERYYGIDYQQLGIEKRLGRYGRLEPLEQSIRLNVFHLRKTAARSIQPLDSQWKRGSLSGVDALYSFENPLVNGFSIQATNALFGTTRASHRLHVQANRTYTSKDFRFSARFGFEAGGGSRFMPVQQRYNLANGSTIDRWNNKTYWSFANISESISEDLNLVFDSGNALAAYAISGSASAGVNGNNAVSFTMWNTARPFLRGYLRPLLFEVFAGSGKAWNGGFVQDFELPESENPYLATLGGGLSYEFSELPGMSRWVRQSSFLNNLQLSVRTPFYVHNPADGDEWSTRWMFGINVRR